MTYSDSQSTSELLSLLVQWYGYIKDYDGGTLMECILDERIPYTDFPSLICQQRMALDTQIRQLSKSHVVHPGLTHFQQGQRKQLDIASIPGKEQL
jgi:histone acetyltransferase